MLSKKDKDFIDKMMDQARTEGDTRNSDEIVEEIKRNYQLEEISPERKHRR